MIKAKSLRLSLCCPVISSSKGFFGDSLTSLTWTNTAEKYKFPKNATKSSLAKLSDLTSETRPCEQVSFNFAKCPEACPISENCATFIGTSQFNDLGLLCLRFKTGINHVGLDLDKDLSQIVGFKTMCYAYRLRLKSLGATHFWVTLTISVNDEIKSTESWNHTIVVLVVLVGTSRAIVVDPSEADLVDNGSKCSWLSREFVSENTTGKSAKKVIRGFFDEYFGVKSVKFGTNDNGLASPPEMFRQFPDDCNVAVTVNLFFVALGYKHLPRFPKTIERAIFCRLRRLHKNNENLPAELQTPVSDLSVLSKIINVFIRE